MTRKRDRTYYQDLLESFKLWELIWLIANTSRTLRFARTRVGSAWMIINQAVFIATVGLTMSYVWKQSVSEYLPYLALSQILWLLANNIIVGSTGVLIVNAGYLKDRHYPRALFSLGLVGQFVIETLFLATILVVLYFIFLPWDAGAVDYIVAFLMLVLYLLFLQNIAHSLALIGARYRDVQNIVVSLMQIAYFLTPILWKLESLKNESRWIFELNPLFIFMQLVRDAIYKQEVNEKYLILGITFALVSYFISDIIHRSLEKKITYWL